MISFDENERQNCLEVALTLLIFFIFKSKERIKAEIIFKENNEKSRRHNRKFQVISNLHLAYL